MRDSSFAMFISISAAAVATCVVSNMSSAQTSNIIEQCPGRSDPEQLVVCVLNASPEMRDSWMADYLLATGFYKLGVSGVAASIRERLLVRRDLPGDETQRATILRGLNEARTIGNQRRRDEAANACVSLARDADIPLIRRGDGVALASPAGGGGPRGGIRTVVND